MSIPYPPGYSEPYSYEKCGVYKLVEPWINKNLRMMGSLPDKVVEARLAAVGCANSLDLKYRMVRDYISKAETFKVQLQANLPSYRMEYEWSSYYYNKVEKRCSLDIEKAMLLIRLVFKYLDECRAIDFDPQRPGTKILEINHLEPILNIKSPKEKKLDTKRINDTIHNYKRAKEILAYILDLNIEESKFPELNKTYLRGLLYYIQGLQMIFVGYFQSYGDNVQQPVSLYEYIDGSELINIRFDNGVLGQYYATAAEFLNRAHSEFTNNLIQSNTNLKLLIPFFKSMSFLLYGIPMMNLYEYNSVERTDSINRLKIAFNSDMSKIRIRLRYIKNVKSLFVDTLNSVLYNKDGKIKNVIDYYGKLIDNVEHNYREDNADQAPDNIVIINELNKEPNPIIIANAIISNCEFCGFELNIPQSVIDLPQRADSKYVYNEAISLLFPDIADMK